MNLRQLWHSRASRRIRNISALSLGGLLLLALSGGALVTCDREDIAYATGQQAACNVSALAVTERQTAEGVSRDVNRLVSVKCDDPTLDGPPGERTRLASEDSKGLQIRTPLICEIERTPIFRFTQLGACRLLPKS